MGVVFVTGAAKNTGLAIAEKFASRGYDVAISSRDQDELDRVVGYIREKYGVKVRGYSMELSDISAVKATFSAIENDFGSLDVFVANAAQLGINIDIFSASEEDFDNVIDVNLKGNFFACQCAALIMKKYNKGSIVIIGSVHSKQSVWGRCLYSLSKGGLNALVHSMAVELAPYGIRANVILAGAIRTDRWEGISPEVEAARRANWPLGIESTGEDIANGVYYLGTDLSKTVTGTELVIDSGILASLLPNTAKKN